MGKLKERKILVRVGDLGQIRIKMNWIRVILDAVRI